MRLVLDTNVLVSALMLPEKSLGVRVAAAFQTEDVLMSYRLWTELVEILTRTKFNRYFDMADATQFLTELLAASEEVKVGSIVNDCRDLNDNHVLALALDGRADIIVSGDEDLLVLHPWRGIPVQSPRQFITT